MEAKKTQREKNNRNYHIFVDFINNLKAVNVCCISNLKKNKVKTTKNKFEFVRSKWVSRKALIWKKTSILWSENKGRKAKHRQREKHQLEPHVVHPFNGDDVDDECNVYVTKTTTTIQRRFSNRQCVCVRPWTQSRYSAIHSKEEKNKIFHCEFSLSHSQLLLWRVADSTERERNKVLWRKNTAVGKDPKRPENLLQILG